jgi:transcriptional regulator
MYVPPQFRNTNHYEIVAFIREYSFGLLLSNGTSVPFATHLPFIVEQEQEHVVLTTHIAKANEQFASLQDGESVKVVFAGPHAFISPSLYTGNDHVPTWNYIAVHASGSVQILNGESADEAMKAISAHYDPDWASRMHTVSENYMSALKKEIVVVKITVHKLEAQFKLSQNRIGQDRQRIKKYLLDHKDAAAREAGSYMKDEL